MVTRLPLDPCDAYSYRKAGEEALRRGEMADQSAIGAWFIEQIR